MAWPKPGLNCAFGKDGKPLRFLTIPFRRDIIHRPIFTIAGELRSLVHAANKSDARTEFLP
jgi:hypothetical protein